MLLPTKSVVNRMFLKISTLLDFVTKLIFQTQKNLIENTNKGGNLQDS